MWQITELPYLLAGFQGAASRQGREGKWGKEEKEEKGMGIAFPTSFLQLNHCFTVYSCCDLYTVARLIALQLVCSSVCRHNAD